MNNSDLFFTVVHCVEETPECDRECFLGCGKIGDHHCQFEPFLMVESDDVY